MHYIVGHNVPGYMPETESYPCETLEEARSVLIADLLNAADGYGMGDQEDIAEEYAAAAEDVNLWSSADSVLLPCVGGEYDLGTVWWIVEAEGDAPCVGACGVVGCEECV